MMRKAAVFLTAALSAIAIGLTTTDRADALVYWGGFGADRIGRVDLNGKKKQTGFMKVNNASGVAVTKSHIYWSDFTGAIQRARLDGTKRQGVVSILGGVIRGIEVRPPYIYWGDLSGNRIGRARLNGSDAQPNFITGANDPVEVATNSTHLFWANNGSNSVGRSLLDSGGALQNYLPGGAPGVRALAATNGFLFWTTNDLGTFTIGRAPLGGGGIINPNFIDLPSNVEGLTVGGGKVYWTLYSDNRIGRANSNGSGVNNNFVTLAATSHPAGIAVDGIKTSSNKFKVRKVMRGPAGTVRIRVKLPGPGRIVASGKGVRKFAKRIKKAKGRTVVLKVRPTPGLAASIASAGSAKVRVKLRYKAKVNRKVRTQHRWVVLFRP